MKRRALIIYCDNTDSGPLSGPMKDFESMKVHLESKTGGEWSPKEIRGIRNPTKADVSSAISTFMSQAEYTFILFTGHGYINEDDRQFMEVSDGDLRIKDLKTAAPRQTIIIDACREKVVSSYIEPEERFFSKAMETLMHEGSTRDLFERLVLDSAEGLSILYAADKNEASADSDKGAPYLISLLKVAENWRDEDHQTPVLTIRDAHRKAAAYLAENFDDVTQEPVMKLEKRVTYYPFAVKLIQLNS